LKTEPNPPKKKNQNKKMESTTWAAPFAFWSQYWQTTESQMQQTAIQ
jgi:hypothetical protein